MVRKCRVVLFFCLLLFGNIANSANESTGQTFTNNSGYGFVENKGQVIDQFGNKREDILFSSVHNGIKVFLKKNSFSYEVYKEENEVMPAGNGSNWDELVNKIRTAKTQYHRIDIELVGCNKNPLIISEEKSHDYINYSSVSGQTQRVYHYNKITYKEIYPNIDFVYQNTESGVKYDFVVHPGGNLNQIKLRYDGMNQLKIGLDGNLSLQTAFGDVVENIPLSYLVDETNNSKKNVIVGFKKTGNIIGFQTESYNPENTLVIDPAIQWSTYYGGSGKDECYGITKYNETNIIVSGYTNSTANIASSGAFQGTYGGGVYDAFVIRFNNQGARQWATYYGANGENVGTDVATDAQGNIILVGFTEQSSGISTTGAHQINYGGGSYDAFVAKFDSLGIFQWGTYYGGSGGDMGTSVSSDNAGNIVLGGYTSSTASISTSGSHQPVFGGGTSDAFIVKFNASGVRQWATYYGGNNTDEALGIVTNASTGDIAVTGFTKSTSAIINAPSFQSAFGGDQDAFIAVFDVFGVIDWATYYGGTGADQAQDIDMNECKVAISGFTNSNSGIASSDVHQTALGGSTDAFIARFDLLLGTRDWGTYYGGSNIDKGFGIKLSPYSGFVLITGYTLSINGIAVDASQIALGGGEDAFIADFDPSGVLRMGTYLGGPLDDRGFGVAGNNSFYISGYTESTSAISSSGSFQTSFGGGSSDGFVTRIVVDPRRVRPGACGGGSGNCGCGPTWLCDNECLTLFGSSYDDDPGTNSFQWTITGFGSTPITASNQITQVCYNIPGTYAITITLVVTNASGVDPNPPNPLNTVVTINPSPVVNILENDTLICYGSSMALHATGAFSYTWSPSTGLNNAFSANPIATPLYSTTYFVTGADVNGCTDMDAITIIVPPPVNAGADVYLCEGQGGVQLNAYYATSYSWSPSTGLSDSTISNPFANPDSTITYYVAGIDGYGCQTTDSIVVSVNPLPVVVAGVDDDTVCYGSYIYLSASGANSYLWTPFANLYFPNLQNPTAYADATITYYVTGTTGFGCEDTDSVTVFVLPHVPIQASGDTLVCSGTTVQLNVTGGGNTYTWSPPDYLSDPDISNPTASPIVTTFYYVTSTDSLGCTDMAFVGVFVPDAVNAGSDTSICLGQTLQLNATNVVSYTWTPSGSLSNDSISNPVASPVDTAIYYVAGIDSLGCFSNDTIVVVVNIPAIIDAGVDSTICSGTSIQLNASGGGSYTWSPSPDLDSLYIANPIATVFSTNTYTVSGTDINGCYAGIDSVTISTLLQPSVEAGVDTTICSGSTVQLNAMGGGTIFLWSPANGLNDSAVSNPTATATGLVTYNVTVTDTNGCQSSDSVTINVWNLPIADAGNDTAVCNGAILQLNATGGLNYSWLPQAGLSNPGIANPVTTVTSNVDYWVIVTDANGCSNTDSISIIIMTDSAINASFTPTIDYCNSQVSLTGNVSDSASFFWNFGDGNTSTEPNPVHVYANFDNTYTITLIVNSLSGCYNSDTVVNDLAVYAPNFLDSLILPNVFTPNGDGENDLFTVGGVDCMPYYFEIYDRWGVKMFEANQTANAWNGAVKGGKQATSGLYYYILHIGEVGKDDQPAIAGFVHLVR